MVTHAAGGECAELRYGAPADHKKSRQSVEKSRSSKNSQNSGAAELKEDGQVSCDTAHNLRLTCLRAPPAHKQCKKFFYATLLQKMKIPKTYIEKFTFSSCFVFMT